MKIRVSTRAGEVHEIEGDGRSLMETIRIVADIAALCGGCAICGTCHVLVDPEFMDRLEPMGEDEDDLLATLRHRTPHSRLSCQIQLKPELDGLSVAVADEE